VIGRGESSYPDYDKEISLPWLHKERVVVQCITTKSPSWSQSSSWSKKSTGFSNRWVLLLHVPSDCFFASSKWNWNWRFEWL